MMEHRELRKYLRDDNGQPWATVVSNEANSVGWAVCSPKEKFCKARGVMIARAREAKIGATSYSRVPVDRQEALSDAINYMLERSKKYFRETVEVSSYSSGYSRLSDALEALKP